MFFLAVDVANIPLLLRVSHGMYMCAKTSATSEAWLVIDLQYGVATPQQGACVGRSYPQVPRTSVKRRRKMHRRKYVKTPQPLGLWSGSRLLCKLPQAAMQEPLKTAGCPSRPLRPLPLRFSSFIILFSLSFLRALCLGPVCGSLARLWRRECRLGPMCPAMWATCDLHVLPDSLASGVVWRNGGLASLQVARRMRTCMPTSYQASSKRSCK
ncbi:hypothetical protein A0H81_01852 [Grifola frondosa]|uniref:Uncharacterized protein n=1 Tax=Grifola frondosa TaxID=5627 RepID=A0A1C7ML30_GRIFR|nr:hypothetical protein A0H81_01852 [Grifola frondosa]